MAQRRGSALLLAVPVIALSLFLVGCPKRPATTAASAPPPTGSPTPSAAAPSTAPSPSMTPSPAAPSTATTTPPRPSEFTATANLKDVFFDFDKYDIRPNDAKMLDTNAAWLKSNDDLVLIEGHCDERGGETYNFGLGDRRAAAVRKYLVAKGVDPDRLATISYGKKKPFEMGKGEPVWSKNRRAHFVQLDR